MQLFVADDLVVLVAFAGQEDGGSFRGGEDGGPDGFAAVRDEEGLRHAVPVQPGADVADDGFRVLGPAVVGSDHEPVGQAGGDLRHLGTLGLVPVPAAAEQADELPFRRDVAEGGEDVLQRVGGMGIVDDDREVPRSADVLQPSGGGREVGEGDQDFIDRGSEAHGRRVDRQEVVGVVGPHEAGPGLFAVDAEKHPLETLLEDAGRVVRQALAGVGDHFRGGVLDHHGTVLVIHVDDGVCLLGEVVEEQLLTAEVFGEGLVVIQVVVREVGEDAGGELQSGDPLLLHADGAHFHEAVAASGLHHLRQEAVDRDGVSRGIGGLQPLVVHIVGNRGQEAGGMAHRLEQAVQQGDGRRLPVRPGDSHQRQLPGRMPVERVRRHRHRVPAVLHFHPRRPERSEGICFLANHGRRPFLQGGRDILMPVGGETHHGDEEGAGRHLAGVAGDGGDVDVQAAVGFHVAGMLYDVFQFHFKVSRMVSPFFSSFPAAGDWAVTWPEPS